MNILLIGTTDILGGAAKVSWELKSALTEAGHTVSMFVADKRSNDPSVRVIPRIAWRKIIGFLLGTESLIKSDWILDTQEFKDADIIHCHNLHGRYFNLSTLEKMSHIKPVVWTLHDEWALTPHCAYTIEGTALREGLYMCPSIDIPPRLLWDNSLALAQSRAKLYARIKLHIVASSLWLKERAERTVLKDQDIRLISNGIDTNAFVRTHKTDARTALNLPLDKTIILFLATDAKNNTWKGWKHVQEMIERYKHRDDVLFLCVGNLNDHDSESNVIYRGHVRGAKELSRYYSAADTLLFTSVAENFPLVMLEAMSCGLPVVTFDVGGVKQAVTHGENGYVARYTDNDDLAEGLEWILKLTSDEREKIALASSEKVREYFSQERLLSQYFSLYTELLNSHG